MIAKFSNVEGFKEPMADLLTTGGIEIMKMPKKRLFEWLEFLKPELDALSLGGMDGGDLSVMLWFLTGIRPNAGVHNFNCKTYGDLHQISKVHAAQGQRGEDQRPLFPKNTESGRR